MRSMIMLLCFGIVSVVLADGPPVSWPVLTTTTGITYREAKLTTVEVDGIKIAHADGVARIPFEQLSPVLREQFGFDPVKAEAARKDKEAAAAAARKKALATRIDELKSERERARVASLEWRYRVLRVHSVLPDGGLICYLHNDGGGPGEVARATDSLTGGRPGAEPSWTDYETPLYVEGVKEKVAEGEILRGEAARDGSKEFQGRTLQRWISRPAK